MAISIPGPTTIPPWTKGYCESCGEEFQRTRMHPCREDNAPKLCDECDAYQRGYDDGLRARQVKPLGEEIEDRIRSELALGHHHSVLDRLRAVEQRLDVLEDEHER